MGSERYRRLRAAGLCIDCLQPANGQARCECCRARHGAEELNRAKQDTVERQAERCKLQRQRIERMLELTKQIDEFKRRFLW